MTDVLDRPVEVVDAQTYDAEDHRCSVHSTHHWRHYFAIKLHWTRGRCRRRAAWSALFPRCGCQMFICKKHKDCHHHTTTTFTCNHGKYEYSEILWCAL